MTDKKVEPDEAVAENIDVPVQHALANRGHSVVTFADKEKGKLRITCHGSPETFLNGVKDCDFHLEIDLKKPVLLGDPQEGE